MKTWGKLASMRSEDHPGCYTTLHETPDGYTGPEWAHMVKCYHTNKGHIIREAEFYFNPKYDALTCTMEELRSNEGTHGVRVVWFMKGQHDADSID